MPELIKGLRVVIGNVDDVISDHLQDQLLEVAIRGVPLQPLHLRMRQKLIRQGPMNVAGLVVDTG